MTLDQIIQECQSQAKYGLVVRPEFNRLAELLAEALKEIDERLRRLEDLP